MARDHARVNLDIWNDPDFRALPMPAQHLYLVLWTHPDLTYCGSIDWRPARLSGLTEGADRTGIEEAAACLQARHFLVVDEGTEEALIRSWIKFDGLMKQPRMAISCVTAYGAMGSDTLRKVVVHELAKVREALPGLAAWGDERVARVLDHPSVSAKDLPTPSDPFGDGLTPSLGQTQPKGNGSVYTPPTPAPAPTTHSSTPEGRSQARAARIDPDFAVDDDMRAWAKDKGLDYLDLDAITEDFVDYWLAKSGKDATKVDWVRTWQRWVRKESTNVRPFTRPQQQKRPANVPEAW